MKKIILFMYFLPSFLYSQSGFNMLYEFEENPISSGLHDITNDNDTLITVATSYNSLTYEWDLRVLKIDSFGNLLNVYSKESELGFNMVGSKILKTDDGGYFVIGDMTSQRGCVLKLNHEMEEEFFKIVYDSTNFTVYYHEVVEVSDGYIIGGYVQMSTWDSQAWAMKLDYEGNEIWHHRYGAADTSEFVYAMEVMADGSVMITGVKNNYHETGTDVVYWRTPWVMKIDANNGEMIWEKIYINDAAEQETVAIYPMPDGTYLSGGPERTNDPQSYFRGRLSLRRLDEEGNLMWKELYGPIIRADVQHIYEILPLPDGRFVAICNGKKNNFLKTAITICFNPEDGEEYWTRVDTIPIDTINNGNNHVQGGAVLSSGSVVVAGYNNTGRSYGWLLKMDKNGCIQDDCETYVGVEDVREVVALPVLFPNPAESYFRIKGEHEGDIGIYSVSGRLVKEVAENLTFGEIGVGDLPKGLYFVRGQSGSRVWVLKLVR